MSEQHFIIGFATKFYTLWSVVDIPYNNQYGEQIGVTHRYAYIKKLTMSRERACAMFPDAPVDESLRGHRGFDRFEPTRREYADDEFNFGMYAGTKVADCADAGYLAYVWHRLTETQQKIATKVVERAGWHVVNGDIFSNDQYNAIIERESFARDIASGYEFDVLCTHSLDEYGKYAFKGYDLYFPEHRVDSYNGFYYALPVVNGHAKRIKNKMVHVTGYELDAENGIITIKEYQIIK